MTSFFSRRFLRHISPNATAFGFLSAFALASVPARAQTPPTPQIATTLSTNTPPNANNLVPCPVKGCPEYAARYVVNTGFSDVPTNEFGLEIQLDFAGKGSGRTLQMVYATGTNEAYIKADNFLNATVTR